MHPIPIYTCFALPHIKIIQMRIIKADGKAAR